MAMRKSAAVSLVSSLCRVRWSISQVSALALSPCTMQRHATDRSQPLFLLLVIAATHTSAGLAHNDSASPQALASLDSEAEASFAYSFRTDSLEPTDYGPVNYGAPSFSHRPPRAGGEAVGSFDVDSNSLSLHDEHDGDHHFDDHPPPRQKPWGHGNSPLRGLRVHADRVTLSGLSSGAGLAQQLLISHPSLFAGIAVFQQTFYRCGRGDGDMVQFDNQCTNLGNLSATSAYDPALALNDIRAYFRHGLIEDPRLLRSKRLYVFAGLSNAILRPEQQLALLRVFEPLIQNPAAIRTRVMNAASHLPTNNFGVACDEDAEESAFLANCGLNGAHEALSFLLGEGSVRPPRGMANLHSLHEFDQTEFFDEKSGGHSMARFGYVYVPHGCAPGGHRRCLLHFYFHGCRAGVDVTEGRHLRFGGFLELAEENGLVVVFPQIRTSEANAIGCWDSYGYTNYLYATQRGVQVAIIRRLLLSILDSPH